MTGELRLGDYREVLLDVECDALIADPPYGARTHAGHNAGVAHAKAIERLSQSRTMSLPGGA